MSGWLFCFYFGAMEWINVNGKVIAAGNVLRADNRSYRYGDGLFETMKVVNGKIFFADLHFERLNKGLFVLKFKVPKLFTQRHLQNQILDLCKKNNCEKLGRVRLSVSGGHGGLYDGDEKLQYIIECWPLSQPVTLFNENGLVIDTFPHGRKSCDVFSNLKSASHLLYAMAARFAKENKLNDCLVLNSHERVCDTTIANLFWVKEGKIFTTPLREGCIAGVMRRHLIETLQATRFEPHEKDCEIRDLENADEIFVTNVIQEIKWVKQFRNKTYDNQVSRHIREHLNRSQDQ
jgi:Branched-chain amino acid aminotransferase/4-amino-4-deoxychorismate lyase